MSDVVHKAGIRVSFGGQYRSCISLQAATLFFVVLVIAASPVVASAEEQESAPVAGSFRLDSEVQLYSAARIGSKAGGPDVLDPRGGSYARFALKMHGSSWSALAALVYDGRPVPFRAQAPSWDPELTGLRFPLPEKIRFDEAWVQFAEAFWIGRRALDMGGGTGLIGLTQTPGIDQVGVHLRLGEASYRKIVGRLSPGERYLLAHQLDLPPLAGRWGTLQLSAYELGVVSERFASLAYTWVPLWPGYLTQHLEMNRIGNNESNFYIGVAAEAVRPFGWGGRVRAEVLVDDMPQSPDDRIIYQLGGALVLENSRGWSLRYARVNNYVGTFQQPALSLVHAGRLLAFPDGPDSDSLKLAWRRPVVTTGRGWQSALELSGISLEWRRRGPGRIGDIWEVVGFEEAKAKEFLAGTVEHALLVSVDLLVKGRATATLTVGPIWNTANQPGDRSVFVGMVLVLR